MKRLLEFGKKAMFYVRVLSGYEERRIRSYRLQLEQRLRSAQEKKEASRKIPEQIMLSEIRKMVEEMQNVNKRLEEMEGDINEYFKPIDKKAGVLMDMQMEKDKEKMEMMGSMYKQALIEKAETQAAGDVNSANQANMETMSAVFKQALLEKAEAEVAAEMKKSQKEQNLPLSKQDIALWTDWTPSIKRRPSTIANAYQEPCYSQEAFDWEEDGRVCKIKYKE